jgi:transposase
VSKLFDHSAIDMGMRFALWAKDRRITMQMVRDHFGVSRATAYRYMQRWNDVRGIAPRRCSP